MASVEGLGYYPPFLGWVILLRADTQAEKGPQWPGYPGKLEGIDRDQMVISKERISFVAAGEFRELGQLISLKKDVLTNKNSYIEIIFYYLIIFIIARTFMIVNNHSGN